MSGDETATRKPPRAANVPNVAPLGEDGRAFLKDVVEPVVGSFPGTLLSFNEAKIAGEAMFDRAHIMAPDLRLALTRDDAGWADLARIAWEAVWSARRAEKGRAGDEQDNGA